MDNRLDWAVSTKDGVVYVVSDEEAYAASEAMEKNVVWKCPRLNVLGLAGNMIKLVELARDYRRRTGVTRGSPMTAEQERLAEAPPTPRSKEQQAKIDKLRADLGKKLGWPNRDGKKTEFKVDGKPMDVQEVYNLAKSKGYLPSKGESARAGSVAYLAKQGARVEEIKA